MNSVNIAEKILSLSGGEKNIVSNAIIKGMLVVKVKEMDKVEIDRFMEIKEILGVLTDRDNVVQIVIDKDKLYLIGNEFFKLTENILSEVSEKNFESKKENKNEEISARTGKISGMSKISKKILNIFEPVIPALIVGGAIKGILNIADIFPGEERYQLLWWYQLLKTAGWGIFTYLPIFICMNTVKEFKGTPILGALTGIFFIKNPLMPILTEIKGINPILPSTQKSYIADIDGVFIVIIFGIIIAYIERILRKIIPKFISGYMIPFTVLLAGLSIIVFIVQPFLEYFTNQVYSNLNLIFEHIETFGGFLLSFLFLPFGLIGLNNALIPVYKILGSSEGPTAGLNYIIPVFVMSCGGQLGAGIAIFFKTRNKNLKKIILNRLPLSIIGVNEPFLYTVSLPLIIPFITASLGGGIGGMLAGFFNLSSKSSELMGVFSFLTLIKGTEKLFLISMSAAFLSSFLLTYFFGVNEKRIEEIYC